MVKFWQAVVAVVSHVDVVKKVAGVVVHLANAVIEAINKENDDKK